MVASIERLVGRLDFAEVGFLLALVAFVDCERLLAALEDAALLVFVDATALVEETFELEDVLGLAFAWVRGVLVFAADLGPDLELFAFARVDDFAALVVDLGLGGVFFVAAGFFPLAAAFLAGDFFVDTALAFLGTGFRTAFSDEDLAVDLALAFALEVTAFAAFFLTEVLAFAAGFAVALLAAGLGFGFAGADFGVAFFAVAALAATLGTDFLEAGFLVALDFALPLADDLLVAGAGPCAPLPSVAVTLDCVASVELVALSGALFFDSVGDVIFDSLHDAQDCKSAKLPKITHDC